jgi:hypothetical protein
MLRNDEGPKQYGVPAFTYLNQSAREDVSRIREVLEVFFQAYSSAHRAEFRKRFRSTDDLQHRSAFFELFLHELFLRLNCTVDVHPEPASSGGRRPDFLVECPSGKAFFLEAVVASNETKEESKARARISTVYDAINRIESPDFFFGLDVEGALATPPPIRLIKQLIRDKLTSVDFEEIKEIYRAKGLKGLPRWPYEHAGWRIIFYPIPKSKARGKINVRSIGLIYTGVHWIDSTTAVREAIVRKAKRYGSLELPYVIAVNCLGEHVERIDIMEALFGTEQFVIGGDLSEPEFMRKPDGAWRDRSGPRYTRVSAVLITSPVLPWSITSAPICLYHNPWAQRPYSCELTRLPQAIPLKGSMEWRDGESLVSIFGLPLTWPRGCTNGVRY